MAYPSLPTNLPPATPQKPLPGTYFQTPAPVPQTIQAKSPQTQTPQTPMPKLPPAASQTKNQTLSTEERGARTINNSLQSESRYPDLDSYLSRKIHRTPGSYRTDQRQRALHPSTTFPLLHHGRPFKKSRCTTSPIRFSTNITGHKFRPAWVCLLS